MSADTGDKITRIYGSFRGVDFRGDEINIVRSPDCLNVWRDYKEIDSIRTRPGVRLDKSLDERVYGIYFYHGEKIVHSGNRLIKIDIDSVNSELYSGVKAAESNAFIYDDIWYFMDGENYLKYDGNKIDIVNGYIPTTTIGRNPSGGGEVFENVNLLSPYRINTFLADGVDVEIIDESSGEIKSVKREGSNEYFIDTINIDNDYYPEVKVNDEDALIKISKNQNMEGYTLKNNRMLKGVYDGNGEPYEIKVVVLDADKNPFELFSDIVTDVVTFHLIDYKDKKVHYEYNGQRYEKEIASEKNSLHDYSRVYWNGEIYTSTFIVDYAEGKIVFDEPPLAPDTDGKDNVSIKFRKTFSTDADGNIVNIDERYSNLIKHCTLLQVFDNRVFVSGNAEHPNMLWHCKLNDPTYFGDLDYYQEGMDSAQIKGMVAGNNALWVFREPSDSNTNVFYHNPAIDEEYGKIYPSSHSSITLGCEGRAINFNDDIVFFSQRGMEGISGDVTTEQIAAHRSSLVDRKMISLSNYKKMLLEEWEGYLLVFIDNKVFLADSRAVFSNENHVEYEWFYWELDKNITCTRVYNDILYLGSDDGLYIMSAKTDKNGVYEDITDSTRSIESYWVTPKDKFKAPNKLKSTNKRGCVVEANGDITIFVKTENTDFELIEEYKNITDFFTTRIKRKKFKDIQLKFYSNTRFSLETVSLECFIGGYIKR